MLSPRPTRCSPAGASAPPYESECQASSEDCCPFSSGGAVTPHEPQLVLRARSDRHPDRLRCPCGGPFARGESARGWHPCPACGASRTKQLRPADWKLRPALDRGGTKP